MDQKEMLEQQNSQSCHCVCPVMIRLLRAADNGWYIAEHRSSHNHPLSLTCGEKVHWLSHKHIDVYTKDLVKQLRTNNVNLNKVYNIVGNFVGSSQIVPFTVVNHIILLKEVETAWGMLIEKYNLKSHNYMPGLYEICRKWAKPYFKAVFCAKMTSTQRSESANNMLKIYMPPASPMHVFVRPYMRLQFDQESDESYQEKRTRISGVVMRTTIAIEMHASKVDHTLGRSYQIEEVEKKKKHIARHNNAEKREKWSKVEYEVTISDVVRFCECGQFADIGMLCCHVLKVMDHIGVQEIPMRHILKRWTKYARDIFPQHIAHFQKDQAANQSFTCGSSTLYLHAMELVRIGDSSVDAYELVLGKLKEDIMEACPLSEARDGLEIEDKLAAESERKKNGSARAMLNGDVGMVDNENKMTVSGNLDALAGLSAPSKQRGVSREKVLYEGLSKRTEVLQYIQDPRA